MAAQILFVVLVAGALVGTLLIMARAARAYGARTERAMSQMSRRCPSCKSWMLLVGVDRLPVAMSADGWQLLFAEPAEVEGGVPIEVHTCPVCRHLELALPPLAVTAGLEAAQAPSAEAERPPPIGATATDTSAHRADAPTGE
ncbi:MAG: hypothetical protein ACRDJ4_03035 [Actinomycetota bacterium]